MRRRPGAREVGWPTLHSGPVVLRSVRATPCSITDAVLARSSAISRKKSTYFFLQSSSQSLNFGSFVRFLLRHVDDRKCAVCSVRPTSVRRSVTSRQSRHCTKMARCRIKNRHTIARDSSFLMPKISAKFQRGHPKGRQIEEGLKSAIFDQYLAMSQTRCKIWA